jgi:hypothetical protein
MRNYPSGNGKSLHSLAFKFKEILGLWRLAYEAKELKISETRCSVAF